MIRPRRFLPSAIGKTARRAAAQAIRPLGTGVAEMARKLMKVWQAIRSRHTLQLRTDPTYASALAAGSAALTGILTGSPVIATAIAVLIQLWLDLTGDSPRRPLVGRRHRTWDEASTDWDAPWDA